MSERITVRQVDLAWAAAFERLVTYVAEHGHARPGVGHVTGDGHRLGGWVATQRAEFRSGRLSTQRQAALEGLPGWAWSLRPSAAGAFASGLAHLTEHVTRCGTADVVHSVVTGEGYRLGQWASWQRGRYLRGVMPPEEVAALEVLPGWRWSALAARATDHSDAWDRAYVRLTAYVAETGHAMVPQAYRCGDGYCLGAWVSKQRREHRRGDLPARRARVLESTLGWAWLGADVMAADHTAAWDRAYARLAAYVVRYGTAAVPSTYRAQDGFTLGAWVSKQRRAYREGHLTTEQIERLENLTGWQWDTGIDRSWHRRRWLIGYDRLRAYAAEHGHATPTWRAPDDTGYIPGRWAYTQRQRYRRGQIPPEQIAALEALPGWDWAPSPGLRAA